MMFAAGLGGLIPGPVVTALCVVATEMHIYIYMFWGIWLPYPNLNCRVKKKKKKFAFLHHLDVLEQERLRQNDFKIHKYPPKEKNK